MKLDIDWTKVDSRYKYAAMDIGGFVFLYETRPSPSRRTWHRDAGYVESFAYPETRLGESCWKDTLTERPTEEIKISKPKHDTSNTHLHADFITEALADTSRKIEGRYTAHGKWTELGLDVVVGCSGAWEFRFADTVKPTVTSPLTGDELMAIWEKEWSNTGSDTDISNAIAVAAKVATIKEVANMPREYCPDEGISELYGNMFGQSLRPQDKQPVTEFARYVWVRAVTRFQAQLLKLIGE